MQGFEQQQWESTRTRINGYVYTAYVWGRPNQSRSHGDREQISHFSNITKQARKEEHNPLVLLLSLPVIILKALQTLLLKTFFLTASSPFLHVQHMAGYNPDEK